MSNPGKKREAKSLIKTNGKKTRQEASSDDSPVVVIENTVKNAQSISLSPDLDELLHPMTEAEFLDQHFRKKAVHITCMKDGNEKYAAKRVSDLREAMFDLDPEMILRETSSDNIFLWLVDRSTKGQDDKKANNMIRSIEVSDVDTAISLFKIARHATYCRAPPMVEQNLVASLLKATGELCSFHSLLFADLVNMIDLIQDLGVDNTIRLVKV